ncbi:hypothetical protein ACH5RR_013734 [Cinchona calisaya]|uniref:J domain-containing protein n=1 Tax=Cinchona calisaya TaxID=153742 RepID=A0ABD3A4J2_9GENT
MALERLLTFTVTSLSTTAFSAVRRSSACILWHLVSKTKGRFEYSEVFGSFNGLDFTVSFADLVRKSNGGDYPSDDAWTSAQSESLSDESDPSVCSERSQSLVNADPCNAVSGIRQFDISYPKVNQRRHRKISNVVTHIAQLRAIPGHAYVIDEIHASQKGEASKLQANSDLKSNMDFGGRTTNEKQFKKKSTSLPKKYDVGTSESDFHHLEKCGGPVFSQNQPFVTVNKINLRTKPSRLPPPSRPPPVFAADKLNSKLKACKSYTFEQIEGDSLPSFCDVEIDGKSSMMASSTVRDTMEKAQANIRSAKVSMEKKEFFQSSLELHSQIDIDIVEETMSKTFDSSKDDTVQGKCAKQGSTIKPCAEERNKIKMNQEISDLVEREGNIDLTEKPTKRRYSKQSSSSFPIPHKSEGTFAWRQATEYFEVVEADVPFKAVEHHKDENMLLQIGSDEFRNWVATEAIEQLEDVKEFKVAKEEFKDVKLEVVAETFGHRMRSETTRGSSCQTESEKEAQVGVNNCILEMSKKKLKMGNQHEYNRKLENVGYKNVENQTKADFHVAEIQAKSNLRCINTDKMLMGAHARKANDRKSRENFEMDNCHARLEKTAQQEGNEKGGTKQDEKKEQEEYHESQNDKRKQKEVCDRNEHQNLQKEVMESEYNEKRLKGPIEHEKNENDFDVSSEKEENKRGQELEKDKRRLREAYNLVDNVENFEVTLSQNHEERRSDACEPGKGEVRLEKVGKLEHNKNGSATISVEDVKDISKVTDASHRGMCVSGEAGKHEELCGRTKDAEQIMRNDKDKTVNLDPATHLPMERENMKAYGGEDSELGIHPRASNLLVEKSYQSFGKNQNELQHEKHEKGTVNFNSSPHLQECWIDFNGSGINIGNSSVQDKEVSQWACNPETTKVDTHEQGQRFKTINGVQITSKKEILKNKVKPCQPCMVWAENGQLIGAALSAVLEDRENAFNAGKKCSQNAETKEKNLSETLAQVECRIEERLQKERELEKEYLRKMEGEREREKDRMAVDKAFLEGRDRSHAEARGRAERAAVERATAEVQQRVMAEAREKLEKASLEDRERSLTDKASVEVRLRAERAAVERATLEARQRAFEKAMADKTSFEARERVERFVSNNYSASCRTVEMRQISSFSDLLDLQSQSAGTSNALRYSYSTVHAGLEGESPQRCKARLERYRRTAERAAKALAEKNMRDLLVQREPAERNRLAEALDAEVKRWSSGKVGNLRALLSTLQYILGPDNGWQPIPLTEVITTAAVKKAYRKATLCVHPDKLQQRGASIQQKYICEKVFDFLKDAWSIFNSEEW